MPFDAIISHILMDDSDDLLSSLLGDLETDPGGQDQKPPNINTNPIKPAGLKPIPQAQVTKEMTNWAKSILHDSSTFPMFATTQKNFNGSNIVARVEWHSPDFNSQKVHRGVSLYTADAAFPNNKISLLDASKSFCKLAKRMIRSIS